MIGIIAGTGSLPGEACIILQNQKREFFVINLFPEDNLVPLQQITKNSIPIISEQCYKPARILQILKEHKTTDVLLIGKVDKRNLLKKISLDWFAIKMLSSLIYKNDTNLMERIVQELKNHGMNVINQDDILGPLKMSPGVITGNLTDNLVKNISFGMQAAQQLSLFDIGQTVVVKNEMILAVEAIEGTDECIQRGISLGISDIIICKAAQPHQNKKFDLPTLGPQTLHKIEKGSVRAIAWLSSHTLIAQQQEFIRLAQEKDITLVSYEQKA